MLIFGKAKVRNVAGRMGRLLVNSSREGGSFLDALSYLCSIPMTRKEILSPVELNIILHRMACQLVENHGDFKETVLIGLQPRGGQLAKRLMDLLRTEHQLDGVKLGLLDTTFFRDDFRRRDQPLQANQTQIDFLVEGKRVVFVDDVLFTGRSVRAALDAVLSFGRPAEVELMVLIDRRFTRHLPIQPNYTGKRVDSIQTEKVLVEWAEEGSRDAVYLITS